MVRTCQEHPIWECLDTAQQRRALELRQAFIDLRGFPDHIAAVLAVQTVHCAVGAYEDQETCAA